MDDQAENEFNDSLSQNLDLSPGERPESAGSEQPVDFQRYLEPDRQLMGDNFENMDPCDLPGQYIQHGRDEQNQSLQKDLFEEEELIQIGNNGNENPVSNAAYQRSRPDGSPMFSQSSGFVVGVMLNLLYSVLLSNWTFHLLMTLL